MYKEKKNVVGCGVSLRFSLPHQDRVRRTITDLSIVLKMQGSTQSKLLSKRWQKHEETPRFGEVFDQRKKSPRLVELQKALNPWNPNPFVDTCCFITAINTIRSGLHIGPQAPQDWQSWFSVGNHTCAFFGPKRFVVPFKKKRTAMSLHLKR